MTAFNLQFTSNVSTVLSNVLEVSSKSEFLNSSNTLFISINSFKPFIPVKLVKSEES